MTNPNQPSVKPALSECGTTEFIPDQSQVEETIDPISPSLNPTFPEESEYDTTQVLFVSSNSNALGGNPSLPSKKEENTLTLIAQGVNSPISTIPPLSSLVTSFDWNQLTRCDLPSYAPFHITVHVCNMIVPGTIIDEGASVSILSSTTWQALGSPPLVPITQNLLAFNRGSSQPLGILP